MDCVPCCSSAAVSSTSRASPLHSVLDHSFSVICSVDSLRSRDSRILGRCFYLRTSPPFRVLGSSFRISAALSSSAPVVVSGNASPLEKEGFPSSSPSSTDKESDERNLSARERRKLRNERREAAIASQEQPWKERVQDRLLEPKKKIKGWQEDADINRCVAKGVQWWMIQTAKKFEFDVAEQISALFAENFPGREIEVLSEESSSLLTP